MVELLKKQSKNMLIIYLLLTIVFVVIQFNGSQSDLVNRICNYKAYFDYNYNIIPFRTLIAQFESIDQWGAFRVVCFNIIWFLPLGFLLPFYNPKLKNFLSCFCVILVFVTIKELLQRFSFCGIFDVDDIILNCVGANLGYFISRAIIHGFKAE